MTTELTLAEIEHLLRADAPPGDTSREKLRAIIRSVPRLAHGWFGWADYPDGMHTKDAPFALAANTPTPLPNAAQGTVREQHMPLDVDRFYDPAAGVIPGRNGDGVSIGVEFVAVPSANNTTLDVWIDIGGGVPPLYRKPFTFPRQRNEARQVYHLMDAYQLDTWEANGGRVMVEADNPVDIYSIRYVIKRTSKA